LLSADLVGGLIDHGADHEKVPTSSVTAPDSLTEAVSTGTTDAAEFQRRELVIVDASTPNYQQLIDDLVSSADDGRQFEVAILEAGTDGVAQISLLLGRYSDLDAIHLISHGSEGSINLGNGELDLDGVLQNAVAIQGWGNALTTDGDLLIYGCNLAGDADGMELIDMLSRLTGADVAASVDLTGGADQGGDWDLEYHRGLIEVDIAFSAEAQANFSGVLAAPTINNQALGPIDEALANSTVVGTVVATDPDMGTSNVTYEEFTEAKGDWVTSLTISTPVGVSQGDLLIAAVVTDGNESGSLAPPAGEDWNLIDLSTDGAGEVTLGVWWKIADAAESPSHQWTWSGNEEAYGWIMRVTGHDVASPIDVFATNSGNSNNPDAPSVVTTVNDAMILRIGAFDDDDVTIDNPGLDTHTPITMDESTSSNFSVSGGAGYETQATSGPSGNSLFSLTGSEQWLAVTLAIKPGAGDTLTYAITGGNTGGAFAIDSATGEITVANSAALDFETNPTFNLTVEVTDNTLQTDSGIVTINVNDLNETPTAADKTVVTPEDTDYTFTVADFNFSDPDAGDTLQYVQITSLETAGALKLSTVDVVLDQVIDVADIIAGNLTFSPVPGQSGAGHATFGFKVSDGTSITGNVLSSFNPTAGVHNASDLAFDGTNLWLSYAGNNTIYEFDTSGTEQSNFSTPVLSTTPTGLTFDGTNLWLADRTADTIYELDTAGTELSSFLTTAFGSASPVGLTFDGTNLWLADRGDNVIYKIDTSGALLATIPTPGSSARGLTWDGTSLWILDDGTGLVYELNPADGTVLSSFAAPGSDPAGLTFDGTDFWYADNITNDIYQLVGPNNFAFSAAAYTMTI